MFNSNKLIKFTIVTLTLGLSTMLVGSENSNEEKYHNGHAHSPIYDKVKKGVSQETIERAAMQEVQTLVAKKKIPKSWRHVLVSKIGKTHYGDTDDWVVVFDNMKIKNKNRRTLYIFVSVGGEIRGANYTGN